MCIIIVRPAGVKMPPKATLDRCAALNPHGFGFATKDRIYKTLSYSDFISEIKTIDKNDTAILHFRYATHGSIKTANCHPFRDDDTGVSFAHNGVLSIVPIKDMTDSETAFRTRIVPVIKEFGFDSDEFIIENHNIIGGSRFAYIDKEGEYRLYGSFFQYRGCWYSNRNFLPYKDRYGYSYP
jgi:hypothetical protein